MNLIRQWLGRNGMNLVNLLLPLTLFTRVWWLICIAYAVWAVTLSLAYSRTESRGMKSFYSMLVLVSLVLIAINIYTYAVAK